MLAHVHECPAFFLKIADYLPPERADLSAFTVASLPAPEMCLASADSTMNQLTFTDRWPPIERASADAMVTLSASKLVVLITGVHSYSSRRFSKRGT